MVGNCVSSLLSQFISNCRLLLPSTNSSSSISAMADEMLQPAAPVSYPLKTLEELRDRSYFASFHSHFNKSRVPLLHAGGRPPNSQEGGGEHRPPRLLVCHDMKGGYQDDRWVQGNPNGDAYSLWHWHLIDTFVYFSHSLVTLPPPCWTNTAHRHGVQVLGTFITEWDEGKALCKNLLASKESTQLYASRLAELAAVLGFDGWLINIENEVEKQHLDNLLEFVRLLTMYMHQMVPGSTVIWYDSVTKDGKLRWQNCLNDLNKCYFDLCDGIFTNYTWKKDDPVKSAVKAGDRRCDVYMGVDVFGRNTFGGGGFQSNVALKAARDAGVSAALFAPGWVYETDQGPTFPAAQNRWWGLVAECWPFAQRYPIQLPFFSNFDQGFGKELYLLGSKISRTPWSNISCQNLQPVLHIETQPKQGLFESIVSGEYPVYSGGACVKFSGSIEEQAFCMTVLYEADVATNMPLTVSYTVRHQTDSSLSVLLKVCDQKGAQYILLVDSEEESNEEIYSHQTSRICILCPSTAYQVQGSQGWSLREYSVEVTGKLEGIFAISYLHKLNAQRIFDLCKAISSADSSSVSCETTALESTAETVTYEAFLGHIAVSNTHEHNFCNGITFKYSKVFWEELPGQRVVSLMLTWVMEDSVDSQIVNYRIYVSKGVSGDDEFEHLGVAMVEDFYVSQLPVPKGCQALTFYLQMSCTCGFSTRLDKSPIIVIPVP